MMNVKPSRSLVSAGSTVKDIEGDELPYPPMPKPESLTDRVICTICSEPINMFLLTEDRWKAHVDADLHPYVCISEQCKEPLKFFQRKQDWVEHMQTRHTLEWAQKIHTEVWQCDIGHSETKYFDQKDHYLDHLKTQHDGQFTSSQIQGRARRNKKTATREPFVCPFCDCIPDDIEYIVHEKPYSKLATHIRRHLKYISFFSLSYLGVDFGDSESTTGSSSDDNEERASRSSHSLSRLKDVSLSDIPETEITGHSRRVQGEVFPDVPLDIDDSDWSFIPQAPLETNWDMLKKGFGSEHPVPEQPLQYELPAELLAQTELHDKQPCTPSIKVPVDDKRPSDMSSFHEQIPSQFLAIAIDFGTVSSSVSYAFSTDDSIHDIAGYPGFQSVHGDPTQVPTIVDLKTGSWGYQVEPSMEKSIKWLKLLLLNEDEIQYDEIRNWRIRQGQRLHELGTTAVDVVSTFLRKIWSHTLNRLKVVLAFSLLPLRVAITVPAIWPPYAERAMRQAAQMAGILDKRDAGETLLRLVQEPEAAGLHFLLEMQPDVHYGDSFVVCDAGGSSVDVVTYLVESVEPFRVKECVIGSGTFAGGILINEKFVRYLSTKENFNLKHLNPDELLALMRTWETNHKSEKTEMFFHESSTSIQTLVHQQCIAAKQQPKYIFLTGGLSGSPYICKNLENSNLSVKIAKSRSGSSAVAHGAVARLLQYGVLEQVSISAEQQYFLTVLPEITARKSRYSYGVAVKRNILALRDYDPEQDKVEIDHDGQRVTTRLSWCLFAASSPHIPTLFPYPNPSQGDEVERHSPVVIRHINYNSYQLPERLEFEIVYSASRTVPNRPGPRVKNLGRIECIWDKTLEKRKRGEWSGYDRLTLAMVFDGEQPKLRWEKARPNQSIWLS
ncbi:hypothetical protein NCS57_00229600 [Fusarium keratoplasticum]|uniref:Uncharacterized protein n=1 Tax=Fusarium keratoplasticum TaxID=1328300 RepID=A0ACC0R8A0_9HYPO|nr:hypothetical protein NCS57_00229600 [Fusarium keratoplasticum]KAI8679514.1 hypothetical protein NCS57_00229600 [Fusarium keratoplasticum]